MDLDNSLFQEEAFRGERTSLRFRWILIAVVLLFIFITYIRGDKSEAFLSFIPASVFLIYNIYLGFLIRNGKNLYFLRYFSVTIDIIALSIHIYINSRFFSPIAVSTTASIFIYPVLMFLSVLRYDKKLIIYASLLTLLVFNLNYIIQFHTIDKTLMERVISSDPMGQIYKSGYLMILGYFFLKIPDLVFRHITRQKEILEEKNDYIINLLLEKREKQNLKTNLKELNALHADLKQKTEKIEEQNKKLNELVQTKDRLISFISHDLKNSFSTMSSIIETTMENLSSLDGKDLYNAMDILHKHSRNNHVLFENLLQWAQLQRGQITVNKQKVNISEFCTKTFKQYQNALEQKDLSLDISVNEKIMAYADPLLLTSICNNLLGNAIKFSNRGGTIHISAENENNMTRIEIRDEGVGMKKEKIGSIFSIEGSISTCGTEGEKGSGFGLILCKELVERNGGQIEINSDEGKGCSIRISLARAN